MLIKKLFKKKECKHEWESWYDKDTRQQVYWRCSKCGVSYSAGGQWIAVKYEELDNDL